ncbi:hypothetical protein VFPBJ_11757 [Purpureocillium lilacinum]|uniref:Uncharacterized protein n=1 Tax=Purpureocillium lilacinum TaxID=33203 RepID=A0A179EVZ2_PURLI|nr:hypothetical protein VFPBJ_11757 [Purpureocillium lilacinum]
MSGTEETPKIEPGTGDCICIIQWIEPHGPEDFIWLYTTQCPVVFEHHTCYRPFFTEALNGGFGWGKDPSGGIIIINGGGVSSHIRRGFNSPFGVGVFKLFPICAGCRSCTGAGILPRETLPVVKTLFVGYVVEQLWKSASIGGCEIRSGKKSIRYMMRSDRSRLPIGITPVEWSSRQVVGFYGSNPP